MNAQQEKEEYMVTLNNFTDRELVELQTYYARKTMDYSKSSNGYLFVIYLFLIISVIIGVIVAVGQS